MIKNEQPKILFYTTSSRNFRTTLIGHLYEISQKYPVVLLSEKLDHRTEEILNNKTLFPKLEEIVPVRQFTEKMSLWSKNRYLYNLAMDVISRYKPDIIISDNDICLLEMYLFRFGKKIKAMNLCLQGGFLTGVRGPIMLRLNLENAYLRMPEFFPVGIKLLLAKLRKHLGHIIYYWILPLTVGELPFLGKSSYMLWRGNIGLRGGDYYAVFSKRDFDICVADGVPAGKLYILSHPLAGPARKIFEEAYFSTVKKNAKVGSKILTIMMGIEEISFYSGDFSIIRNEEMLKTRIEAVALIAQILEDWGIFIKLHPDTKNTQEIIQVFGAISNNIKIVDQNRPADEFIEMSDAILGFPPCSNSIFTSLLQCPEKPILSLDLQQELLGDSYRNFVGIEYINNKEKLINILELIRDGQYKKRVGGDFKPEGFSSTVELLKFLLKKDG